jgi:DNA repair exonuclease SbcCD ATPase subunit
MKRFIFLTTLSLGVLSACTSEPQTTGGTPKDNMSLENRIAQLEKENAQKDSMINESLEFFREIQSNLESIEVKKDEIRVITKNPEISNDDKAWIMEQIKHINYLREENAKKVVQLNKKLKESGLKIKELNSMIEDLLTNIRTRDEQIGVLQDELSSLDKAYTKLFDAYQEKADLVEELTDELNTVYYSYGTEDELVKNQVIERKNGFIGIGKKIKLMDNFNEKYFAKVDMREEKEIFVEGSELKFITDHPSSSYKLVPIGKNTKIKIVNPNEFWKVSNYLVVVVE